MVYTDLLFLFAFLPIATALVLILSEPWEKNLAIVISSLIFIVWARPIYYVLIILPVIVVYFAARLLNKEKNTFAFASASGISILLALTFALQSGADNTLKGAVCAIGFLLFALRAFMYLDDVNNGREAEKDFLALAVYLISYEFILISPLAGYYELEKGIKTRRTKLSSMALGMKTFIIGLAKVAILGLAFDRIRLAALYSESTPWMNAIIGLAATAVQMYIVLGGYNQMSAGIATVNGIVIMPQSTGIKPRASILAHTADVYLGLAGNVVKRFVTTKRLIATLIISSLAAGLAVAFGCGEVALFGLVLAAMAMELLPIRSNGDYKLNAGDIIVNVVICLAAFIALAAGSLDGIANFIGAFNLSRYEFDISYALYDELTRGIPWAVIGLISITPLPEMFEGVFRARMAENEKFYSAIRTISSCLCVGLLILSIIALVSAQR